MTTCAVCGVPCWAHPLDPRLCPAHLVEVMKAAWENAFVAEATEQTAVMAAARLVLAQAIGDALFGWMETP